MTALSLDDLDDGDPRCSPLDVEIVVPVHDEEAGLERSVRRLVAYLSETFPWSWQVTIADNASHDGTWRIATDLASTVPGVHAVRLSQKGRGRALKAAWGASDARVVAYMDVDLSTDLAALAPLVAPLLSGHSELAIGTRLAPDAHTVRGPKREIVSRAYNLILRTVLGARFSDAQCGFKAIRRDVAATLVPRVRDDAWFFDTELLVLAEHNGLRIHEVPVDWTDDADSRVDVVGTAIDDLRGVWRVARAIASGRADLAGTLPLVERPDRGLAGQLARFAGVGFVSTVAFAALFAALQPAIGAIPADLVALTATNVSVAGARFVLLHAAYAR